jgi:ABC-type metal ion transport system substrate-binding protein
MFGQAPKQSLDKTSNDIKDNLKDMGSQHVEKLSDPSSPHGLDLFALRQQYPLLANASEEKLAALNKAVLRRLDWVFLPVITMMLLMK